MGETRQPIETLGWLYDEIMELLSRRFVVYGDSRKLFDLLNQLEPHEANRVRLRWAPELSAVMVQYILLGEERAEVELTYELMRKNRPALYQELVLEILNPKTSHTLRQFFEVYCDHLRQLNDWFNHSLHAAFEEHSGNWWDEIDEDPGCLGEYESYLDALQLAFNETYINFDILEQVLAAIRRVIR